MPHENVPDFDRDYSMLLTGINILAKRRKPDSQALKTVKISTDLRVMNDLFM